MSDIHYRLNFLKSKGLLTDDYMQKIKEGKYVEVLEDIIDYYIIDEPTEEEKDAPPLIENKKLEIEDRVVELFD